MANSYIDYTGNGSLTTFTGPSYLEKTHIQVAVDGVVKTLNTDYSIADGSTSVVFGTAPAEASEIRISRSSSPDQRLTDYTDASLLTADAMDRDANQLFFLAQEAVDSAERTDFGAQTFYSSGTTDPSTANAGDLFFNSQTGLLKIYNGSSWESVNNRGHKQTFVISTSTTVFTPSNPVDVNTLVFLNGVLLVKGSGSDGDYTTSSTQVTLNVAVTSGVVEIVSFPNAAFVGTVNAVDGVFSGNLTADTLNTATLSTTYQPYSGGFFTPYTRLRETGNGSFKLEGEGVEINVSDGTATNFSNGVVYKRVVCTGGSDNGVVLKHGTGDNKLATTDAGIDVTGDVAATTVTVGDSTGTNLELYEDGSQNAIIRQRGTGSLQISGINGSLSNDDYEQLLTWGSDAIHLSWQGSTGAGTKLSTTATGIDVTGTVTCDEALTISSDGSGDDAKPDILLYNNATAADGERLGQITYYGKNSATETINYGWHEVKTVDVTDSVEDSVMEFWVRNGAGNHNKSLTLNKDGIDVTGTVTAGEGVLIPEGEKLRLGSETDSAGLDIYESTDGDSLINQYGDGNLIVKGQNIHLRNNSDQTLITTVANSAQLFHRNGDNEGLKLETTNSGIDVTGTVKGLNFKHDNNDVTDQSWSSFARNGGANVLYVQQGATDQPIASFRKGSTQAAAGTEVLGVNQNGIDVTGTVTTDEIVFPAYVDDFCSIETNVNGSSTNLDFQLGDDNGDAFRFRFDHHLEAGGYQDALKISPDSSVGTGDKFIVDVTGTVTADLLTLHPTGGASEGGQINFQRDIDDSNAWYVDVFGATTDTKMRFVNVSDGLSRLEIDDSGIQVTGDIEVTDNTKGVILKSPNGSRFRLEVANDGTLSTEAL